MRNENTTAGRGSFYVSSTHIAPSPPTPLRSSSVRLLTREDAQIFTHALWSSRWVFCDVPQFKIPQPDAENFAARLHRFQPLLIPRELPACFRSNFARHKLRNGHNCYICMALIECRVLSQTISITALIPQKVTWLPFPPSFDVMSPEAAKELTFCTCRLVEKNSLVKAQILKKEKKSKNGLFLTKWQLGEDPVDLRERPWAQEEPGMEDGWMEITYMLIDVLMTITNVVFCIFFLC